MQKVKKIFSNRPLVVAHRGASGYAPENTLPAFRLAWKMNADAIEGDFHLTWDGRIVCIHDGDTKRVSGAGLRVAESTYAELQRLDVGAYKGRQYQGTRIPTIADVFATVPENGKIFIEIKDGAEIIRPLARAIELSGLKTEQIVVISFDENVICEIKALKYPVKGYWLSDFKKNAVAKKSVSLETVLDALSRMKADGLGASQEIDEPVARAVISHGYELNIWTVDTPDKAQQLMGWGVSSITTNLPDVIKKALD